MRATLILTAAACAALTARAADAPGLRADANPEAQRDLKQVERAWNTAFKNHDRAALAAFCAEDFQATDDQGKVTDKAQFLTMSAHVKVVDYSLSALNARIYGDAGVVTGEWHGKVSSDNGSVTAAFSFTDTFVRRAGRWWAVASQMTSLPSDTP